jgi:hypothetical protein
VVAGWVPEEYLESAVRDLLTAGETRVDATVGFSALLLASVGASEESDRLVAQWHAVTERPVALLTSDSVHARAWAMVFAARSKLPDWAAALTPLDLDAEERAHTAYLSRCDEIIPIGLLGDSAAAKIVSGLARKLDSTPRTDKVRTAAANVESKAREGDLAGAHEALNTWADLAGARTLPDVPALAACRHVAPLLVAGADPLGLGDEWARHCAGALIAALHRRYPAASDVGDWPDLVASIMRLRGGGEIPPPAKPSEFAEAEHRLGTRLPEDYRDFLSICDGLPPDEIFPRLLGVAELMSAEAGVIVVSERSRHGVIALSPVGDGWLAVERAPALGTTTRRSFRAVLEHHLRLLRQTR